MRGYLVINLDNDLKEFQVQWIWRGCRTQFGNFSLFSLELCMASRQAVKDVSLWEPKKWPQVWVVRLLPSSVTHLRISSPQNIHGHIREPVRNQMLTRVIAHCCWKEQHMQNKGILICNLQDFNRECKPEAKMYLKKCVISAKCSCSALGHVNYVQVLFWDNERSNG